MGNRSGKEARFAPSRSAGWPPAAGAGAASSTPRQREAFDRGGGDICVVTPASGKTMCYNLPVLNAILKNSDARALYLFPTKALSADQVSAVRADRSDGR
ncbi:MAG: DEAD/DEAH box helicase [Christensenellales bacterium]